ncbi:MAG TPA: glucose-1-phosphate adenylyltransferase subunit GlgD [Defluviitoga sp.]|nr:glucose-1-phosphate adenylyltransferase subunit GlgD [Defluviitoga sp.]HOP24404.1 glucose-1-phosphate adenylyltransferase subunit GlgD [Defluviitoga sp.]HPZ28606.1 glucose-1-phosphate adenylyltransferase subunit GlgD [Defluviitoga sp.]HQD62603.1 glucose-1-phosphate adenylyltransferase subunit GlgD [Defluviitoga sp.]
MRVMGLILSGSSEDNLDKLTIKRTSAAVPVFGKYRAIDFTLSNMVNSGIINVGVLTQYNPRSLMDHLGSGKEWNLDRKRGGLFILQPFMSPENPKMHYEGTADALFQNLTYLRRSSEDFVLIGSGDHIYNMDYRDLFKFHVRNGADITLLTRTIDKGTKLSDYGQVVTDENNRVLKIYEKVPKQHSDKIFLGVYFMNKAFLMELLYANVPDGKYDLLLDIIIPNLSKLRVFSYDFNNYWRNIKKSVKEYYDTNMDILKKEIRDELFYNPDRTIYTKLRDSAPPKININAQIKNSFIADGCIINGVVKNSILSRDIFVGAGAVIEDSIVLQGSVVEEGGIIRKTIIDKNVRVRSGKRLECIGDEISLIEKGAII